MTAFALREDDVRGPEIIELLQQHLDEMLGQSPPESVHALDVEALRTPDVTLWSAWADGRLAGCGALKQLDPLHAEIKSMRTAEAFRGRGLGAVVLGHLIDVSRTRGYSRISLETGSNPPFAAARRLYERHGFSYCEPFGDYELDPWSVFMSLDLT